MGSNCFMGFSHSEKRATCQPHGSGFWGFRSTIASLPTPPESPEGFRVMERKLPGTGLSIGGGRQGAPPEPDNAPSPHLTSPPARPDDRYWDTPEPSQIGGLCKVRRVGKTTTITNVTGDITASPPRADICHLLVPAPAQEWVERGWQGETKLIIHASRMGTLRQRMPRDLPTWLSRAVGLGSENSDLKGSSESQGVLFGVNLSFTLSLSLPSSPLPSPSYLSLCLCVCLSLSLSSSVCDPFLASGWGGEHL